MDAPSVSPCVRRCRFDTAPFGLTQGGLHCIHALVCDIKQYFQTGTVLREFGQTETEPRDPTRTTRRFDGLLQQERANFLGRPFNRQPIR